MRALGATLLAIWWMGLFGQPAFAEKRVALVLGNSAYQNVTRLANPGNDSEAMSATLKGTGFDVVDLKRDLKAHEMRRALRDFSDQVRDADIAIVYFAGHGIEIDGTNYVIPVDAVLERDIDAYDEAISLDRVLTVIEPAKRLRLVILDACRDNPFAKGMKRTIASRAIGRGLAKVEPTSPNTLIAFAAKAGSTAADGDSKHSPFTAALVKHLPRPGLDLRKAFGFVRDDVLKATNNRQEPFIYGSLGGDDLALVPAVAAPAAAPSDPNAAVRRDYELALQIGTPAVWDSFISNYPSGFYADLAKAQRDKLAAQAASIAATEKAKTAADEQQRLAIEGAKAVDQAKAAAQARAAEEARIAAENKKAAEEARVIEAERAKAESDARIVAAPPDQPGGSAAKSVGPAAADIPRLLQAELRRVGCNTGPVDDNWNAPAQKSMEFFNKSTGMKLDVKTASMDSLEAVKSRSGRICPLLCDPGYRPNGDKCVKINCAPGSFLKDDNECEKKRERGKASKREGSSGPADSDRPKSETSRDMPASGSGMSCSWLVSG